MLVKLQKSKQRIVDSKKVAYQPYKYCRFDGYLLEGEFIS